MRRRKIKFPLILKDDVKVRTLEDLQANFDLEKILAYYENGKLAIWLKDRYEDELAEEVEELDRTADDTVEKLCEILGVSSENVGEVSLEIISKRNKRLKEVMLITDDREIINNSHKVVFNQQELEQLLESEPDTVYLYGDLFSITPTAKNVRYVGINNPEISFGEHKKKEYAEAGIIFENLITPNQNPFSDAIVGDIISFGNYDGKRLTWRVLDKEADQLFVFCEESVTSYVMNMTERSMFNLFFNSDLCKWLNYEFYKDAFSEYGKEYICDFKIGEYEKNEIDYSVSEKAKRDVAYLSVFSARKKTYLEELMVDPYKVSLLSRSEVVRYFNDSKKRSRTEGSWWLRSGGFNRSSFEFVNADGSISDARTQVAKRIFPAMWVKTE